ncbi:hypothetical protein A2619_02685 [candidate division WWE3 bacterium RIFOXYD1_FULL_39_9]|uniref:YggT family protein n=1 Tax=candidate division WWE3 bacterium RIFOXYD1_FULL_39_9 TaxID=1802649 RepID=A0A1F4X974_UNCKA|nr:MAG: hypothetical protein A2619_02685 [candidate division WWE3 bacterium RIFOXYD1_FULL_39_9]
MFIYKSLSLLANFIFNFIGLILLLRIGLRFLGANEAAPFVDWIYDTSDPLLNPFREMFTTERTPEGFVIEISSLFALLTYMFLAFFAQEILDNIHAFFDQKNKKKEVQSA